MADNVPSNGQSDVQTDIQPNVQTDTQPNIPPDAQRGSVPPDAQRGSVPPDAQRGSVPPNAQRRNIPPKVPPRNPYAVQDDAMVEWSQDIPESAAHRVGRIFFLVAALAMLALFLIFPMAFFLLLCAIFLLIYFFAFYLFKTKTYDFSLVGDVVRCSLIRNNRRRRKKMKFRTTEVQYIARHIDDKGNVRRYYEEDPEVEACTMVVNYNNQEFHLIIPVNEDFLEAMKGRVHY